MTLSEDPVPFTPLMPDGSRARMLITIADRAQMLKGQRWFAVCTDVGTGRHYEVEGAPCDLSRCFCDAKVLREIPQRLNSPANERKRLEVQLAGLLERIAYMEDYSTYLRDPKSPPVIDIDDNVVTLSALEENDHVIGLMKDLEEDLRARIAALDC